MRRYKNWAHNISSWKDLTVWRPILPVFPRAQSTSFLLSTPNSFQGVLKISSCRSTSFNLCGGGWQVPICGWQPFSIYNPIQHISNCYLLQDVNRCDAKWEKRGFTGQISLRNTVLNTIKPVYPAEPLICQCTYKSPRCNYPCLPKLSDHKIL